MRDNYTFPAILDYSEPDLLYIEFPDFEYLSTDAEKTADYIKEAQDCLALQLIDLEETGADIPEPSRAEDIQLDENQKLVYINVWMPYHRSTQKVVYTKKTLTIPVWIDMLAKQNNINFFFFFVEGLKKRLGLS